MFRSTNIGKAAVVTLCATLSLCALKASAESMASLMAQSYTEGPTAAGGESKSGGALGQSASNEVIKPGINSNSQSGGPSTGESEAGSLYERNLQADTFRNVPVNDLLGNRRGTALSRGAERPGDAAATHKAARALPPDHIPVMEVTSYKWGRSSGTSRHTLAQNRVEYIRGRTVQQRSVASKVTHNM